MQEGLSLGLFSIGHVELETPELCLAKQQVLIGQALSQLHAAAPLTLNYQIDPNNFPLQSDCFKLIRYIDENFAWLIDHFTLDQHLLISVV